MSTGSLITHYERQQKEISFIISFRLFLPALLKLYDFMAFVILILVKVWRALLISLAFLAG